MAGLDLNLLVALDALLQEGSVGGAARRIGLSPPAMSHALARLRERLGDPLLVRAGRGMVLTPRAEGLRARARTAAEEAAAVLSRGEPFDAAGLDRAFTVNATDYVLAVLGPALDAIARAEAPGVVLRFVPNAPDDLALLREGATDLAVGIYGEMPPEIRTRRLLTERFVCAVREGHPGVGRELTLERFLEMEHVQIAPRGKPGGYLDTVLAERGLSRRVARAVPYFLAGLLAVARSDYVITVPERLARAAAGRLGLRILEPPIPLAAYALSLVWHPRLDSDPAHRWLREAFVRAALETAPEVHAEAKTRLGRPLPRGRTGHLHRVKRKPARG